ncbi:MAG: NAD(P)/FAD-dependent oxidoreductase [Bacteroidota bacterium]
MDPQATWNWFESQKVPLKVEQDGRVFPQSDSSADVASALKSAACLRGVQILPSERVTNVNFDANSDAFEIQTQSAGRQLKKHYCKAVIIATGR